MAQSKKSMLEMMVGHEVDVDQLPSIDPQQVFGALGKGKTIILTRDGDIKQMVRRQPGEEDDAEE